MRVVNERWNELENELGLGLPLNTLSEVDIANKWRLRALNAEKLLNQPQLTIPQSIADKLDKDDANNKTVLDWVFATEMIVINDEKELKRREDEILRRRAIVSIYGASKALGVDLVKVVADD